jgi:hypothetical protein
LAINEDHATASEGWIQIGDFDSGVDKIEVKAVRGILFASQLSLNVAAGWYLAGRL